MKYQIVPQEDTMQITISENGVSETLTMLEVPSEDSILVQQWKKGVLGQFNLKKLLVNLDICVDLLQITFNAADGFMVQPKVQDLSMKFSEAMLKSNVTALDFKLATKTIVEAYINAYGNLFYGETEIALSIITDIKPIAEKMIKKSEELIKTYDELTDYTNIILMEVMDECSYDIEKRIETKALIDQIKNSIDIKNKLWENLMNEIKQFEEDYKCFEQFEKNHKEVSYVQIASLIISNIDSQFSSVFEKNFEIYMDKLSNKTFNSSKEMQKQTDFFVERIKTISKNWDELNNKERENILKLSEYTHKMKNHVMDENSFECITLSLIITIGCLKQVISYLQVIKYFWINVEILSDNLEKNNETISNQANKEPQKIAEYFKTMEFVKEYIEIVSKWQALYVIFSEYLEGLSTVTKSLNKNFEQTWVYDRIEQWRLASVQIEKLKEKLNTIVGNDYAKK